MDEIFLKHCPKSPLGKVQIGGSKSISNRLLILNALYGNILGILNLSDAEDTRVLYEALNTEGETIDIHHAGTAMRFLTAYYSTQEGEEKVLTGSDRMKQRPIGVLVNALKDLGAEIEFIQNKGFPPVKIKGKLLKENSVTLDAGISSQFITSLLLIAPKFKDGLQINLKGEITSMPYIEMTLRIFDELGIAYKKESNSIKVFPKSSIEKQSFLVESDWSSASYFYSIAALTENPEIRLDTFFNKSPQGDSSVAEIYETFFGVKTNYDGSSVLLSKQKDFKYFDFELNLNDNPDLAQTIAVSCAALNIKCKLTGLKTLKIKETDRLVALKNELYKVGTEVKISEDSLETIRFFEASEIPVIETYDDHRMAMSFAPLSFIRDIKIKNPDTVIKSYPGFWEDLQKLSNC